MYTGGGQPWSICKGAAERMMMAVHLIPTTSEMVFINHLKGVLSVSSPFLIALFFFELFFEWLT